MKINLISAINDLGYGYTGLHICEELIKLGHKVALFPIGRPYCNFRHQSYIEEALLNADQFDVSAPCIRIWHQHDMSMFVGKGAHIGFPIFELDTFTAKEKWHLQSCDSLFVCSEWAKDIIHNECEVCPTNCGNTVSLPTRVVPLGVDSEIFTPKLSKRKPTVFFNCGKWEIRKGHDILVEAFNQAFDESDNVELWMMCENPFLDENKNKEWSYKYKNSILGSKIRVLPRVEADTQVADVMQQADCGIFPSRAEGWNLEALEMLACGKEVIATDYSAHTEFLTEDNALLVPITDVEPAIDDIWFFGDGNWAKIDNCAFSKMVEHMRRVHDLKQCGKLELNRAGIETAKKYSWENTARTIIQHIS